MIRRLTAMATAVAMLANPAVIAAGPLTSGPSSEQIQLGQRVYASNCASCHGADAEGAPDWQRPNAEGELPAPPHNSEGHTWRHSDRDLFEMIEKGWRDPFNKTDRLTMPAFEDVLKPEEIDAVIGYLKTFWTADQLQYQREKSAEEQPSPMD